MRLASIVCLLFFLFAFGCEEVEKESKIEEESSVVVIVDGKEITEKEISMFEQEVARDRAERNLSTEEIREAAIERAIRRAVADNYFEEKGISVSEEEVDEALSLRILEKDGIETEEEYFDLMARLGFSEAEIKRNIIRNIKINKAAHSILEEIEVTEEDVYDYYLQKEEEGIDLPPFSEIEDNIVEEVAMILALEQVLEDFYKERENAQIEILE